MADGQITTIENRNALPAEAPGMSLIERAAFTPGFDLDKLETLMRLDAQSKALAAKRAYSAAMAAAQSEIPKVIKGSENTHTKSKYADLAAVDAAIKPVVTKHGFSLSYYPVMSEREGFVRVGVIVSHAAGHEERHEADFPMDGVGAKGNSNKTDIQAFGSTVTYARRYLKLMVFDIATGDDRDGNAPPSETIGVEEMNVLDDLLTRTKSDRPKFFAYLRIEGMADVTVKQYPHVKIMLERKLKDAKND